MQKTVFVSEVASSLFCLLALYSRVSGSFCCPSRSLALGSLTAARWLHQSVLPPARSQGGGSNGFSKAADPCLPTIRALGALIYLFSAKCSHFAVSAKAEDFCSQITAEREDSTEQKLYYSRGHMSWHRVFGAFVCPTWEVVPKALPGLRDGGAPHKNPPCQAEERDVLLVYLLKPSEQTIFKSTNIEKLFHKSDDRIKLWIPR